MWPVPATVVDRVAELMSDSEGADEDDENESTDELDCSHRCSRHARWVQRQCLANGGGPRRCGAVGRRGRQLVLYLLDTNVLIHDPNALLNFEEHDVIIPMTVLEELDAVGLVRGGNDVHRGRVVGGSDQYAVRAARQQRHVLLESLARHRDR